MFSTSGLTFAFLFVFFVACAAEDSFPVILNRIQTNLLGANQSLADLKQGSSPVFQGLLDLKNHLSGAQSDVCSLPHGDVSVYLMQDSGDLIWDAAKTIKEVNDHFVSGLKSRKTQLTQAGSMEEHAVFNQLIGLFNNMVSNVVDPYIRRLIQWFANLPNSLPIFAGLSTIEEQILLWPRGHILRNLFNLTPVLLEIQHDEAGKLGTEARESASEAVDSICRIPVEVITDLNCLGDSCDREMRDAWKFYQYCHN